MSANGISTLGTKALKQVAKLDLAKTKRKGTTQAGALVFSGAAQLSMSDAANLKLGDSTAFTIEFWIYTTAYPIGFNSVILQKGGLKNVNYATYQCTLSTDSKILFDTGTGAGGSNTGGKSVASSTNLPLSTWTHIAIVWDGTNIKLYQGGVQVGTTAANPLAMGNNSSGLTIGNITGGTDYFTGSLYGIRIVKNVAVYTGAFTVPTSPLTSTQSSGTNITAITGTATGLLLNAATSATYLTDSSSYAATVSNSSVTWSTSGPALTNTSANFYRTRNNYDITQLPTQYSGDSITDNANTGGLVVGRPWTSYQSTGLKVFLQTAPSTGTTWTDTSGNGNNATIITTGNGAYAYTSNLGGGITLTGDYGAGLNISGYNLATDGGTYSVEVVASISSTNYWSSLFGNDDFTLNKGVVAYFGNASNFYISTPTSNGVYAPVSVATRQNINQYIITVTGNTVKFYLNGVSQALTNNTGGSPGFTASSGTPTNGLIIGARHPNAGTAGVPYDSAGGTYYLVRVYNTLLSQTDVTANYDAIKTTYGI